VQPVWSSPLSFKSCWRPCWIWHPVQCTGVVKIPTMCQGNAVILATLHPACPQVLVTETFQWRQTKTLIYIYIYIYICGVLQCFIRHSDGLWAGRPGFDSRQGHEILPYSTASRPALGPTQAPIQWAPGALSSGVKRPRHESDHSPTSNAEVKNGGAILPLPHTSSCHSAYLIKHRDSLPLPFTEIIKSIDAFLRFILSYR
jgi:hypothetical protein